MQKATTEYLETPIGLIPPDWHIAELGSVLDVRDGTHDSPKYVEEGIPFLTSKNLSPTGLNLTEINYISKEDHEFFSRRSHVENGDILFGMIGTIGNPVIVNLDHEISVKNVALIKFGRQAKLNNVLALNILKSDIVSNQFKKVSNGGVQSFISLGAIRKLYTPLPPLPEQKKIASILSAVDNKLDLIDRKITATRTLKKGLMQRLFSQGVGTRDADGHWQPHTEFKDSELGRIPAGWKVSSLSSIASVSSGGTPSRSNSSYWNGDIPWVTTGEIRFNKILKTKSHITADGLENSSAKIFPKDTVLMAMYGQGKTRGQVAKLGIKAATNQACAAITLNESSDADFVYFYLEMTYEKNRQIGNEGSQKNLNAGIIKSFLIPVPSYDEQQRIALILGRIDDQLSVLLSKRNQVQNLKKGLMQKLLTGQWRVNV